MKDQTQLALLPLVPVIFAACASSAVPADPAVLQRLAQARIALAQEDPDAALAITDEVLAQHPRCQEARIVAGEGHLQLAALERKGLNGELVRRDAVREFERAAALGDMPGEAWLKLGEARYQLSQFDSAREAADRALELLTAKKAPPELRASAALLAARCDVQQMVALRRNELQKGERNERGVVKPASDTLELANAALSRLVLVQQVLPAEGYPLAATVHEWLDQNNEAVATLERGVQRAPQSGEVHLAYQDKLRGMGQTRALVAGYRRFVKEAPGQTMLVFYHGRAQVLLADEYRQQGNFQRATETYQQAAEAFARYKAMVPAHADAAEQWLAICELSIARTALDAGHVTAAIEHLFAADSLSPAASQYDEQGMPVLRDSFGSHYTGLVFAISRTLSEGGEDALERTLRFNEAVIERHPMRWGFVYNNAALPARDLGVAIVQAAAQADETTRKAALMRAMELWERSYRHYEAAIQLSPEDPRIVNDCGLMLIYHLHRDYARARELFERAIAVGQPQLDALGPDAPAADRQFLEEAIGDAWQNIGVLLARNLNRPFAEYEPFLQQAVRYYPGPRREAAHMLQRRGLADDGEPAQGGAAEKLAKVVAGAEAKAAAGDLDEALLLFDGVAKELAAYAPFHAARGDFSLRYARQARDAERKGVEFLFDDAVATLKKAVELDGEPPAPRLLLAEAQYEAGRLDDAVATANALLLHLQSRGSATPDQLRAVHRVRANAGARSYMAKKAQGQDAPDLLLAVRTSFRQLEEAGALDAELARTWSATEAWAGAGAEAVAVYTRALARTPDDQALLAAVVDTAAQQGQASVAVAALQGRNDATSLWYLGRARFLAAGDLRAETKNQEAIAELDAAIECFRQSMQQNRDYEESCQQWIAICLGKKGNLAFWMDDLATAERCLLEAVRLRPDRIDEDLGLNETIKLGVLRVADKHFKAGDLARTEAIYRAAAEAATGDVDLQNNAGLFARDLGNQLERAGKKEQAMAMYEQSYRAYTRAQQLEPDNVRLCNDRALIAIWYLERDWELSRELLERGLAEGPRQMEAIDRGEVQQRQDLDEAIGDCWENLALWHLKHSKDAAAAKAAAEQSLQHHPGQRRPGARRHLAAAERMLRGG